MTVKIGLSVYTNSDDAFVAWAPSDFIPGCWGFQLERKRKAGGATITEIVENRVGFEKDKPKSGDHKPSNIWPFQRFNWTDHAVDVGNEVQYRVTAMITDGNGGFTGGPASSWTGWVSLTADAGKGFSCYFNRGLVLSQFFARYMRDNHLSAKAVKDKLRKKGGADEFRKFLQGDLGAELFGILADVKTSGDTLSAALYELDDDLLEEAIIALPNQMKLILANGSATPDGNKSARDNLNTHGFPTIDRLLGNKGLGHNKFMVRADAVGPQAVWTGSTNWATTGLCTQINNGLLVADAGLAKIYQEQWDRLMKASPPTTQPAAFTPDLKTSNDKPKSLKVQGVDVTVRFTPTTDRSDMKALADLIDGAKSSIHFLMFTPGNDGLQDLCARRANEKDMYVKGVVSSLPKAEDEANGNVLTVDLVSSDHSFKPDHYSIVQPQGEEGIGPWIGEVTRKTFLASVGHAIVHAKVLLIDGLSENPILVTGSHNFSNNASKQNDENYLIIKGHKPLARSYATFIMSVYQHYRYRSYIREMLAEKKDPWSYLDTNDQWLKIELKSKAAEIAFWTNPVA
jgi:phosphatidylserine/phosphatidylglycerophosphate/cardiolipin synthase-like enzyme